MTQYFARDPESIGLSVSAMVWRKGQLLLMRRSDNGHWGLPGGFVEPGESVSDAARREVFEETGWSIELGALIGVYSDPATQVVDYGSSPAAPGGGPSSRGRVQVVNLCFRAEAVEQGDPTTPEETLEMGFFAAESLPAPFVPIHSVRVQDGLAGRGETMVR